MQVSASPPPSPRSRPARRILLAITCCLGAGTLAAGSGFARPWTSGWHQDGQASFYAGKWTGRRTSSGARFDPGKLTAAHASLPLGTRLLVTSERTGDRVVVTINDRQPDHGDRIIDLSREAARRLHMIGSGVADVMIEPATASDIRAQAEDATEVAEAPDEADDQEVAVPVSHARHGRRHRLHARR